MFIKNLRGLKIFSNIYLSNTEGDVLNVNEIYQEGSRVFSQTQDPLFSNEEVIGLNYSNDFSIVSGNLSLSSNINNQLLSNAEEPLDFQDNILSLNFISSQNLYITSGNLKLDLTNTTINNLRINNIENPITFNTSGNLSVKYDYSLKVDN